MKKETTAAETPISFGQLGKFTALQFIIAN